jgi:hypothetical protein
MRTRRWRGGAIPRRFPPLVVSRWVWCGRLGQGAPCPVALSLGYVSAHGHTLGALRLALPKEWPPDKARLHKAGVPQAPVATAPVTRGR